MRKTIIEALAAHAKTQPDKPAVVTAALTLSYAELYARARGYAAYLRSSGARPGDIILLKAVQSADYPVAYLGIHQAGCVVTSLERSISDNGIAAVARQVGAQVILSDSPALMSQYDALYIDPSDVQGKARAHADDAVDLPFPRPEDTADILFTTGTTGASKGVELSHDALSATAENLIEGCGYRPDTVMIAPGPLNHANAIRKLLTTIYNGSTIYILDGMMNMKAFFAALDYSGGSIACCLPPAAIRAIFSLTRDRLGEYADRIDFIESATSPLPETDKQKLCQLLPKTRLYNNYGSSEAASVCMYDYNRYSDKEGCIGKPSVNSRITIVDDDHRPIESSKDNMGLIACGGDIVMKGYVNDPVQTAEVLENGVVFTNDIGYIGEDGFVYIAGRKGDVINVGGLKVAPTEVESAALGYDGVDDCICISVDDPISGHALKLLVVMEGTLDAKDMRQFMARHVESYKVPKYYEQVDRVERTYNGKLDRKAYR